jgi:hypothetical protein
MTSAAAYFDEMQRYASGARAAVAAAAVNDPPVPGRVYYGTPTMKYGTSAQLANPDTAAQTIVGHHYEQTGHTATGTMTYLIDGKWYILNFNNNLVPVDFNNVVAVAPVTTTGGVVQDTKPGNFLQEVTANPVTAVLNSDVYGGLHTVFPFLPDPPKDAPRSTSPPGWTRGDAGSLSDDFFPYAFAAASGLVLYEAWNVK